MSKDVPYYLFNLQVAKLALEVTGDMSYPSYRSVSEEQLIGGVTSVTVSWMGGFMMDSS